MKTPHIDRALLAVCAYTAYTIVKPFWLSRLDGAAFWLGDVASFVLLPALLWAWLPADERQSLLRRPNSKPTPDGAWVAAFSWGVCLFLFDHWVFGSPLHSALEEASWHKGYHLNYHARTPKGAALVLTYAYYALTAAVVEETIYRGSAALRSTGAPVWLRALASSLAFAVVHWASGLSNTVFAFVSGVVLFRLAHVYGHIGPPMVAHATFWVFAGFFAWGRAA